MSFDDQALRRAFAERAIEPSEDDDPELSERLWAVATGELTGPDAEALVRRCARDPAVAELWRVTFELARQSGLAVASEPSEIEPAEAKSTDAESTDAEPTPTDSSASSGSVLWLTFAVVAAAAAVLLVVRPVTTTPTPEVDPVIRAGQPASIEAITPEDAAIPRDAFVLEWTGAPDGSHYELRIETESLEAVVVEPDLVESSVQIEPSRLRGLSPGAVLYWRVTATTPRGERLESTSHRIRVR